MQQQLTTLQAIAFRTFLPFIAIFLFYVGLGYYFGVSSVLPALPAAGSLAVAVAVVGIIAFFIRHTAIGIDRARTDPDSRYSWLPLLLILFVFSAFGVLAASMFLLEGPWIVREDVARATVAISHLDSISGDLLKVPDYDALNRRVDSLRTQLASEIRNPSLGNYCGVGPEARKTIAKLAAEFSGFSIINGTDKVHDCKDPQIDSIVSTYMTMIDRDLENYAKTSGFRIPERISFLSLMKREDRQDLDSLRDVDGALSGVGTFILNISLYKRSLNVIERSVLDYSAHYQGIMGFVGKLPPDIPATIDISESEDIAAPWQLAATLQARSDRFTTYLFVLIALALDGLACYAASTVVLRHRQERRTIVRPEGGTRLERMGLRFLWAGVPNPNRNGPIRGSRVS